MKRSIYILLALVLAVLAPSPAAYAGPPSPQQLEDAKKAFKEGQAAFEGGQYDEAAKKFLMAYKLSKKPLLLYNIGLTLDKMGKIEKALNFYRRFLNDAPPDAAQRAEVEKRVKQLENEALELELNGTGSSTPSKPAVADSPKPKAAGTGPCTPDGFEHQMVDSAPPGKPLDVTASIPEGSSCNVILYYRGSGDAKFTTVPMQWHYKMLIGRIPGAKVGGTSIQYYVEVKDKADKTVARSGKSTSPNLVDVTASAPQRFFPDFSPDGSPPVGTVTEQKRADESEDPLSGKTSEPDPTPPPVTGVVEGPTGPSDVSLGKLGRRKWIATGIAGGLIAGAVLTYILASGQASNIIEDRDNRMGNLCMSPPCFEFDSYDIDVEKAGKRYNTIHTLTAVTGVIAASVAAYFWYKENKLKKRGLSSASTSKATDPALVLSPAVGEGFAGAAAVGRF